MTTDKDYQMKNIQRIYDDGALSPFFKGNPKYEIRGAPRIAFSDIMDFKFIIRSDHEGSSNSFWDEKTDIIVQYNTLEELVNDGWRLD